MNSVKFSIKRLTIKKRNPYYDAMLGNLNELKERLIFPFFRSNIPNHCETFYFQIDLV
nr:hypothetical protein GTC16762_23060 [Pigmentibacter ruber]